MPDMRDKTSPGPNLITSTQTDNVTDVTQNGSARRKLKLVDESEDDEHTTCNESDEVIFFPF